MRVQIAGITEEMLEDLREIDAIWRDACERDGRDPRIENYNMQVGLQARRERIRAGLIEECGEADEIEVAWRLLEELEAERATLNRAPTTQH